jgi:hypothetical protein
MRLSKPGYEDSYWCCAAEFGGHERDCPNFIRTTLKATCVYCKKEVENADGLWVSHTENGSTAYCDIRRSLHNVGDV